MRNPKNMLIVGIVLLVVGVCILLFNPDQSAANLEIARNAKNAQKLPPLFQAITKGSL